MLCQWSRCSPAGRRYPDGLLVVKLEYFLQLGRLWAQLMRLPQALLVLLRALWARLVALHGKVQALPRFKRHFVQNLLLGTLIEIALVLGSNAGLLTVIENAVLDKVMSVNARTEKGDGRRPVQLFIDVDDTTWRSPEWGGGEPRNTPWERVADLIERVAGPKAEPKLGARYILVDFLIEGKQDEAQNNFLKRMRSILQKSCKENEPDACPRFLFVRSLQEPLKHNHLAKTIRPAYAVDQLMAEYPQQVFAVAPNFWRQPGGMVRHWLLWESACYELPGRQGEQVEQREGVWAVVPSPQLMIEALEKKREKKDEKRAVKAAEDWDIPWRLRFGFEPGADGAVPVRPKAPAPNTVPYEGARCIVDNHMSNSARLADWQAGQWVWKHFGTCYQQGFFTAEYCKDEPEPEPVRQDDETKPQFGRHLGNRVLFRERYGHQAPHLFRVSASAFLGNKLQYDASKDELTKFSSDAASGLLTVAIIGASYKESPDIHLTPLGEMPGAWLLVNAVDSLHTTGVLQDARLPNRLVVTAACLLVSALVGGALSLLRPAVFSVLYPLVMCALVALFLGPLSLNLIRRGFWLDIAAPFLSIYLERTLSNFAELRKLRKMFQHSSKEHT